MVLEVRGGLEGSGPRFGKVKERGIGLTEVLCGGGWCDSRYTVP